MESSFKNKDVVPKNPLLINTVIKRVLEFVSFSEIKECRVVCQQWNSAAEPFLRELGKVKLSFVFGPLSFLEYSKTHLPDLPFANFHLNGTFWISELQEFFEHWGKNVKSLEFENIDIMENVDSPSTKEAFDINPWMDLVSPNLQQLKIGQRGETNLRVSSNKLSKIQVLSLNQCEIILTSIEKSVKIIPLDITMKCIALSKNGVGLIAENVSLNDFIDFNSCSNIYIDNSSWNSHGSFNLSSKFSNARKMYFDWVTLKNWEECNANVEFLILKKCFFVRETQMKLKNLYFSHSTMNLYLLPKTIETLTLAGGIDFISRGENGPLDLPNLKFLSMIPDPLVTFGILSLFANCPKLTYLELKGCEAGGNFTRPCINRKVHLDLDWIPKTVKRIKFLSYYHMQLVSQVCIDVDVLELTFFGVVAAKSIISMIRPQVLVMHTLFRETISEDEMAFIFDEDNPFEKLIISMQNLKGFSLENSLLFEHVDKQSEYYEFHNQRGRAITKEEFQSYCYPSHCDFNVCGTEWSNND